MKNKIYQLIFGFIIISLFIGFISNCSNNVVPPIKQIEYVVVKDTTDVLEIIKLKEELRRTKDSLDKAKADTLSEELIVLRYKLERIRYYNSIANKGNNIKYLRGWINRVLNN